MEQGYTRTVITTTVNRTYHELRTQRMQDYGQPSGTLGINCRHDFYPFSEDINTNNQHPMVTPEEAIKNADLQQKQRQYERSIRDAKKRLRVVEELDDEIMIANSKTLIANRQKKLRQLIKDTNKNGQILARDYNREQIATGPLNEKEISERLKQKVDKQNQHIYGTKEYNERVERDRKKYISVKYEQPYLLGYFLIDSKQIDEIVKNNVDMRKMNGKQIIAVDYPIAYYRTATKDGKIIQYKTNRMKVHFSKKGCHAVPHTLKKG